MESHPKRILVVDDEDDVLELVAFTLEEEGYLVDTAHNGLEGLEAVRRAMPDLILLDMKMPVMDGPEFARQFHSRYDRRAPILVLTAGDDPRKRAAEVGAVGWIGKPFDLDDLARTVNRHVEQRMRCPGI